MSFDPGLKTGDAINNEQLMDIFKCAQQGGMRRSHRTNSLVLISDHTKSLYEDLWDGDLLHYVGTGTQGDQNIKFQQNKTLANSQSNKVDLFLFEVFQSSQYTYIGPVFLANSPYQIQQLDTNKECRFVWVFPLKVLHPNSLLALPAQLVTAKEDLKEKRARKLSDEDLFKLLNSSSRKAGTRSVTTSTYERNPYVAELAKRRASGICQLCNSPSPFKDKTGKPYLECHHIEWLSKNGEDTLENTVALCPNCHRKMHILNLAADISILKKAINKHTSKELLYHIG